MLPFYHFRTAGKKTALRKVHSRKELFSFLKKVDFCLQTPAFCLETYWIAYTLSQSRISSQ